jgi:predicted benzoate:H+ symporter BenE
MNQKCGNELTHLPCDYPPLHLAVDLAIITTLKYFAIQEFSKKKMRRWLALVLFPITLKTWAILGMGSSPYYRSIPSTLCFTVGPSAPWMSHGSN